jgi:uncharacterized membrane protein
VTAAPPDNDNGTSQNRGLKATLSAFAAWAILIGISLLLEYLFNSDSPVGSGGFAPIPAFFIVALFLGWIPAVIVGFWKYRSG